MTILSEPKHPESSLVSEASGSRSREIITVNAGEDLEANTVLGRITVGGNYVAYDETAGDGSETAAAILAAPIDATAGDTRGTAFVRDCEHNRSRLSWKAGVDEAAGEADLLGAGIILR